jgi:hypothetical protein
MTFTQLHPRGVESDEGFKVESREFGSFIYSEGVRRVVLEGEFLYAENGDYGWGFGFRTDLSKALWEPTHAPVSRADQMRIIANVTRACNFLNGRARFG